VADDGVAQEALILEWNKIASGFSIKLQKKLGKS